MKWKNNQSENGSSKYRYKYSQNQSIINECTLVEIIILKDIIIIGNVIG